MADPHVIKAMRSAHTRHRVTCDCGKVLSGNGRKTHQRACPPHLAASGWPLDDGFCDAIRRTYPGRGADVIRHVEKRLGADVLARREAGNRRPMSWAVLKALVWTYADEWAAQNGLHREWRWRWLAYEPDP